MLPIPKKTLNPKKCCICCMPRFIHGGYFELKNIERNQNIYHDVFICQKNPAKNNFNNICYTNCLSLDECDTIQDSLWNTSSV